MGFIGIDVGGTFTDLCIFDEETKKVTIVKTPTTPDDLSVGVRTGLASVEKGRREATKVIHHGTTLVTNAIIQRKGSKTGLITTAGFRDILEIMRTDKERLYDLQWPRPVPFVARELRREVLERVGPTGDVLMELDEGSVKEAVEFLAERDCKSISVCLLHSYANDVHERRVEEIIRQVEPSLEVFLSSRVDPQYREYERTSTTVLTGFVGPLVDKYFNNLGRGLAEDGFPRERLRIMQSNGGTMKPEHARERAGLLFASGPAAGVVGAIHGAARSGFSHVITMDMGGTSCDVSIAKEGRFSLKTEHHVEFQIPLRAPSVDVISIGAGGGSLAHVDEGGGLHVGPQSAGAAPGPACYGRGGTRPTVTDANLVLGRLPAGDIGGGSVTMSAELAEAAIREHVATPLGLSVTDAALGIIQIANAKMANAIREVSVARGDDPREFALVAFGGAGPLHAVEVADELGIPTVLVPASSGVLSAVGCMISDARFDYMRSVLSTLDEGTCERLATLAGEMHQEAISMLEAEGFSGERQLYRVSADMRYLGQVHEVNVDLPNLDSFVLQEVADAFHAAHARLYGMPFSGHDIEVVTVRLAAIGVIDAPAWDSQGGTQGEATPARAGERQVVFSSGGASAGIYQREHLRRGDVLKGPAVVESMDSTTLISPNRFGIVDEVDSIVIKEEGAS